MIFALSLALAFSAAGTEAADTSSTPAAEAPAPKPKKERKVCRTPDNSATRLGAKVCKTQAEWNEISQRDNGMDAGSTVSKTN